MALISRIGILLAIIAVLAAPANRRQYDRSVAADGPSQSAPASKPLTRYDAISAAPDLTVGPCIGPSSAESDRADGHRLDCR